MVRKSLSVVALLAFATPLAAQDELVWSSRRPDSQAPFGVVGAKLLEAGQFELTYRFSDLTSRGVWFDHDSLTLEESLDLYHWVPLRRTSMQHQVGVAYGATPDLTLMATMGYTQREREQYSDDGILTVADADDIGDLEVQAMYRAYGEGPYQAHLQLGVTIPTGPTEARTPDGAPLAYDMRVGGGTFAVSPGITLGAQNEFGSVGAQLQGKFNLGTNDLDFAMGDRVELNGWAAHRINSYFSVSARLAYQRWKRIDGGDAELDAQNQLWIDAVGKAFDPGFESYYQGGSRLDIPIGLNVYLPEGSRFAGHRLSVEYIHPVSHNYDGPQLGMDWGIVAGWQVVF